MPSIVSVAQRKGGVGKTTLAVCLAAELSNRGANVGLVDADTLQSALEWAALGNVAFPVHEIPLEGKTTVTAWANEVTRLPSSTLVMDMAPTDQALGACFALSRVVLLPCTPSGLDLEALRRTLEIAAAARMRRRDPVDVILVPNRVDARTLEGRQLMQELNNLNEVVASNICDRIDFVRAFATGEPVSTFAPDSAADLEIRRLCDLVENYLPPASDRCAPQGTLANKVYS